MKKFVAFLAGLFLVCLATVAVAQPKAGPDYFAGKWSTLIKGTPQGDVKLIFVLDKNGTGLSGVVQDSTGVEMSKIDKVELSDKSATIYCNLSGYDVNIELTPKDDDNVTGTLMGMFEVEGVRIKSPKQLRN